MQEQTEMSTISDGTVGTPLVIGFCGRIDAGKTSCAEFLQKCHGGVLYSFSDPVKQVVADMFYLDFEMLRGKNKKDRKTREAPVSEELALLLEDCKHNSIRDKYGKVTPRTLLQFTGCDVGRKIYSENLWIYLAEKKIKEYLKLGKLVVIDDVRFDNEAKKVKEYGYLVHIKGGYSNGEENTCNSTSHFSEAGIEYNKGDPREFVIENDTALCDLHQKVSDLYSFLISQKLN